MREVRYYPLVDATLDGKDKVPMFYTTSKIEIEARNKLYLEEIIPHYYRLCVSNPDSGVSAEGFKIRCPICGKAMRKFSRPLDRKKKSLYICNSCGA